MNSGSSRDVVQSFFAAFAQGDVEALVATFHTDATLTAVRAETRSEGQLYGSYAGTAGVRAFIANLGRTFDTKAFAVNHVVGEGSVAFAQGSFTHQLKATGRLFSSDWSLMCIVEGGKIRDFRFFEDSAAFVAANKGD